MGRPVGVQGVVSRSGTLLRGIAERWAARRRRQRLAREQARDGQRARSFAFPRSWAEGEVAARLAVRAGVRLDDFLRARLARYAAALPVALERLGVDVEIEEGEPMVVARPARPVAPAGSATATAVEGPARELLEARTAAAALAERVGRARARLDELTQGVNEDLASGKLPGSADDVVATPEQRGRPPVPTAAAPGLLRALAVALLAAAAYRVAGPALALAGLPAEDLRAALAQAPVAAGAALLLGVGAAVSVLAFLQVAVERGQELLHEASSRRRPALVAAAGGVAVALAVLLAVAAARPGWLAGPLPLASLPLAAVLLLRRATELEAARGEALAAALQWDRARAEEAAERARRGEALARGEGALASALRERAEAEARLERLERRAAEEAEVAARTAADVERNLQRLGEGLAAALELDRYAYLRRAAWRAGQERAVRPLRPAAREPGVGGRLEAAG